jgi:hypothetical protein
MKDRRNFSRRGNRTCRILRLSKRGRTCRRLGIRRSIRIIDSRTRTGKEFKTEVNSSSRWNSKTSKTKSGNSKRKESQKSSKTARSSPNAFLALELHRKWPWTSTSASRQNGMRRESKKSRRSSNRRKRKGRSSSSRGSQKNRIRSERIKGRAGWALTRDWRWIYKSGRRGRRRSRRWKGRSLVRRGAGGRRRRVRRGRGVRGRRRWKRASRSSIRPCFKSVSKRILSLWVKLKLKNNIIKLLKKLPIKEIPLINKFLKA